MLYNFLTKSNCFMNNLAHNLFFDKKKISWNCSLKKYANDIPSETRSLVVDRSWILRTLSYSHGGLKARTTINITGSNSPGCTCTGTHTPLRQQG